MSSRKNKEKLNGSSELFAQAVRGMFEEAMTSARHGLKKDIVEMRDELKEGQETLLNLMGDLQQEQKSTSGQITEIWKVVGSEGHAGKKSSKGK